MRAAKGGQEWQIRETSRVPNTNLIVCASRTAEKAPALPNSSALPTYPSRSAIGCISSLSTGDCPWLQGQWETAQIANARFVEAMVRRVTASPRRQRTCGSALTTEANIDAERPKRRLHPTQVAGQSARIFGPAGAVACLPSTFNANPQKIGGTTRPRAALAHELPQANSDRVRVGDALNRGLTVGCVGASEGTSGLEGCSCTPRTDLAKGPGSFRSPGAIGWAAATCPFACLRWSGGRGNSAAGLGSPPRSGASRSSSPAMPTSVKSAYRRA